MLLTWNREAVTFMLIESGEFPRFIPSQSPIIVAWDGFYCNKWLNWKIPSETSSCTFPDIQSFVPENLSVGWFTVIWLEDEHMWARPCSPEHLKAYIKKQKPDINVLFHQDTVGALPFKTCIIKGFLWWLSFFSPHFNMTASSCPKFIMLGMLWNNVLFLQLRSDWNWGRQ